MPSERPPRAAAAAACALTVAALLSCAASGLLFARAVWTIAVPDSAIGPEQIFFVAASGADRGGERRVGTGSANPFLPPPVTGEDVPDTRLRLILHGLRSGEGRGAAVISGEDGRQKLYALGDTIEGTGARLTGIAAGHATILRDGVRERLPLSGVAGRSVVRGRAVAARRDGPAMRGIDARQLAAALAGGDAGTLTALLRARLDLREGEEIVAVAGRSPAEFLSAATWPELARRSFVDVTIDRDGRLTVRRIALVAP